ncbi:MAG: hypothetical protein WCF67_12435 [Chitinophagaceae bacterium]
MQTHADKTPKAKSLSTASMLAGDNPPVSSALPLVDNRTAPVTQLKLQDISTSSAPIQLAKNTMLIGKSKYKLGNYNIPRANGQAFTEDEKLIITHWMTQEIEFQTLAEFENELATLKPNWEKQKVFYQTDTAMGNTPQHANSTVRMYSARTLAVIDELYLWATANDIDTEGFADPAHDYLAARNPNRQHLDAPFKAHFGDRAHTIKHWHQKQSAGGGVGLISIDLNPSGVTAIQKEKADKNIKKGGEGYQAGKIGLKSEKNFYSAAIGDKKDTWDKLKSQIQKIVLHEWQ